MAAFSAFVDLYLAVYPSFVLFKLQMSPRKKIALSAALGLGTVAAICAVVKCAQIKGLANQSDSTCILHLLPWCMHCKKQQLTKLFRWHGSTGYLDQVCLGTLVHNLSANSVCVYTVSKQTSLLLPPAFQPYIPSLNSSLGNEPWPRPNPARRTITTGTTETQARARTAAAAGKTRPR